MLNLTIFVTVNQIKIISIYICIAVKGKLGIAHIIAALMLSGCIVRADDSKLKYDQRFA